jgi:hypothetical protein
MAQARPASPPPPAPPARTCGWWCIAVPSPLRIIPAMHAGRHTALGIQPAAAYAQGAMHVGRLEPTFRIRIQMPDPAAACSPGAHLQHTRRAPPSSRRDMSTPLLVPAGPQAHWWGASASPMPHSPASRPEAECVRRALSGASPPPGACAAVGVVGAEAGAAVGAASRGRTCSSTPSASQPRGSGSRSPGATAPRSRRALPSPSPLPEPKPTQRRRRT